MELKLYQINPDRDENRVIFMSLDQTKRFTNREEIDSRIYDEAFSGELDCETLEEAYQMSNLDRPPEYNCRTMSVSDVVQVIRSDHVEPGFYFCDSFGFQKVNFDPQQAQGRTDTLRVVILEPGKEARIAEIGPQLEDMQAVVGGYIEAVYPFEEAVALVCCEEGKLIGMEPNRALRREDGTVSDVIAGTCFICDCSDYSFASLTPEQAERYVKQFREPEQFYRFGGQIIAIPYHPGNRDPTVDKGR